MRQYLSMGEKQNMWGLFVSIFLVLYGLMTYYIGRKGWQALGKPASRSLRLLFGVVFALLVLPFPVAELTEHLLPRSIASGLAMWGGYSMIMIVYAFLILLLIDGIRLLNRWLKFIPNRVREHPKTPFILGVVVVTFILGAVIYGGWNARNPVINEYEVAVNKKAGSVKELHIALVSDIHFGPVIDADRLKPLLEMLEELEPDLVLLTGDITDGPLPPGEGRELAAVLGKIEAPLGIFAVPGNHDRDLRDDEGELMKALEGEGIRVLKDRYVSVGDDFYLIGRNDPRLQRGADRVPLEDVMEGVDRQKPLILMDHQPFDLEEAQAIGIDLQLSGHTHRGQIFPANLITDRIYEEDWGMLKKGPYHLIVSCGYGTWGPPLRIGNRPEVVSIRVKFD